MLVRSLGFRTDVTLRRLAGASVADRGDHLVISTPTNPTFYWGNFLLLRDPPGDGGGRWLDAFAAEFPDAGHVAIGIDGTEGATGDISRLLAAGLRVEHDVVMTARELTARARPDGVEIRRLQPDDDWAQVVELRRTLDEDSEPGRAVFVARRAAEARRLVDTGHAAWFAAVVDGRIRSSLGVVVADGIARYQNVETHPDHRRRGLASALLYAAAQAATTELDAELLVIVADPDYVAIELYRSLGFVDTERQVQCCRATRTR